jgi:hypothetical protein
MSKSVRLRRGSTLDHQQFAGAEGEITVDTTLDTVRVHDGTTLGGFPLLNTAKNSQVTSEELIANKILYKNSYVNQAAFPSAVTYPGMLVFSQADQKAYISNGTAWISFTQPSDLTNFVTGSVIPVGATGETLIPPSIKIGTNLLIKTIRQGTNVTLVSDTTGITISSASFNGQNVSDNSIGSVGTYKDNLDTTLRFRSFRFGSGLSSSVSVSGNEINLDTVLKKSFNRISVNGTTLEANEAQFTTLTLDDGPGLTISANAGTNTVTFDLNISAANDTDQTGSNVLQSYSSGQFLFNKISSGTGITLATGTNGEIVISAPQVGTITSGANLGIGPADGGTAIGVFESAMSDASTLRFRRLRPGLGMVITMSPDQEYVDISSTLSVPGGAQAGVVNIGDQKQLAFYPNSTASNTVGPTPTGISIDTTTAGGPYIVSDILGTVSDISNHDTDDLDEGTINLYYTDQRFDTAFNSKSTDHLTEGALNIYFTDDRAQDAASSMILLGNPFPTSVTTTVSSNSTSSATISVASVSGITSGMAVTGPGFAAGVTVSTVNSGNNTFVVSPAVYAPTGTTITIDGSLILITSANTTSTASISVSTTTSIVNGMYVNGNGVSGKVTVSNVAASVLTVTPGYNISVTTGTVLTLSSPSTNGVRSEYSDSLDRFEISLDPNYLGELVRNALNVVPNQGLSYDPVQGRFGLAGTVTSVNGFTGPVSLDVGDIPGAAPLASPTFTGTPRVPNLTVGSNGFEIANKTYVDNARTSILGSPNASLSTLQALGAAINNDSLFFQTVTNSINGKLSITGGTMNGLLNLNYTLDYASTNELVAANKKYVDQRASVQTVNSKSGNVVLVTDDITERITPAPTNLWFTQARARNAISVTSDDTSVLSYNIGSGTITFTRPDTDKITEGQNNLYFTIERVRQNIDLSVTGNVNFASYDENTGVFTINATSDNLSQGVNNKFYTDTLARAALVLNNSTTQLSFLTYNNQTGAFTINANTDNLTQGTNKFYTDTLARASVGVLVTQNPNVNPVNSLTYSSATGVFTFNANTDNITEGSSKLYFTTARARSAISLSSTDTNVLAYDSATGTFTFTKPNTDAIVEGSTNQFFTQTRSRNSISVAVTSSNGIATANSLTYVAATGVLTFNANTDNILEGSTNKYATNSSVGAIVSLSTTTTDGGTAPALLTYASSTVDFTFNNSTDSLREGTINKYANDDTVRNKFTTNVNTALRYGGAAGITDPVLGNVLAGQFSFNPTVSPDLVWRPSPAAGQYNFETAQNLTSTGRPQFMSVSSRAVLGVVRTGTGDLDFDLSQAQVFEVNRTADNIATINFNNFPAALDGSTRALEVTVIFKCNVSSPGVFANSNSNIKFAGGATPTLTNTLNKRDIFTFISYGGSPAVWYEKSRSINV